jgi:two-component sensor histidine kinase
MIGSELQHRVSNTLQSVVGTLEVACQRLDTEPAEAKRALEGAIHRFSASSRIHRRLNDPVLFEQGMNTVLRHAVETVVDAHKTHVSIEVPLLPLSFDQMSIIAMLVIEAANNSQKHVFEQGRGHYFRVAVKALPNSRVLLLVNDDGPGSGIKHTSDADGSLGQTIMEELAKQIGGTLSVASEGGTEISVVFPLSAER